MQPLNYSLCGLSDLIASHTLYNVLEADSPLDPLRIDSLLQKHSAPRPSQTVASDATSSRSPCPTNQWKLAPLTLHHITGEFSPGIHLSYCQSPPTEMYTPREQKSRLCPCLEYYTQ